MTPERWRQIEELYHSAREHGVAVLSGTDPELRREVEELLAQDASGKLLDGDAAGLLAEFTSPFETFEETTFTGRKISHYEIRERLGAGGMGVVYKAWDSRLNRPVALKFLPPRLRWDPELKRQLTSEARAASALDHPNIVVIHEIHEAGNDLFIAMAFHEGGTLRDRLTAPLPVPAALSIASQVAAGLTKAHEHGILHRDIKPGNIVVARDGVVRIIDFGLARSLEVTATLDGSAHGTPLYMSPEQARGEALDARTDVWSLGVVLYQMLSGGVAPFRGDNVPALLRAIVDSDPVPIRTLRPEVPPMVSAIVTRALAKDRPKRYASALAMQQDLAAAAAALEPSRPPRGRLLYVAGITALLCLLMVSLWLYQRSQKRLWAREQALPQISMLRDGQRPLAAYQLFLDAAQVTPTDEHLAALRQGLAHTATITSSPDGAAVEVQDYVSPGGPWYRLGTTPLRTSLPSGYLRWRISKPNAGTYEAAPVVSDMNGFFKEFHFDLAGNTHAPEEMVFVPAKPDYMDYIWSLGEFGPYRLPAYYMDKYEVTNRQFQAFVDQGGYVEQRFWKQRFVKDGRELSWEQAMDLLRDSTRRPGPATWSAGHYPAGQADYPVCGVSWYEAAAYAEWAGKSLPTIAQWFQAAPPSIAKPVIAMSNFSGASAPVGKFQGLGPWGTFDMAGNAAEWCWNESGNGTRYQLGGAWDTSDNEYFEPGAVPPFHRGSNAGFRCVRNSAPLDANILAGLRQTIQDFSKAKPASEADFRIYKSVYAYDRTPLKPSMESVPQDSVDWRKEKIVIDAAYGSERLPIFLFLPVGVRPPWQTVVFFPTARSVNSTSSATLADMKFIDFVIRSGRAVVYPVYKGTYERSIATVNPGPDTVAGRDMLIQQSKDIGRTLDYLATRSDIDSSRLAYMGVSMGAGLGVIFNGVEGRFRTVIFLDGGFYYEKQLPGANQADFAPHIHAPVLMVSGRFDWIFLGKDALLRLMGAPAADKRAVMLDTAHDVSEKPQDLKREVLGWLDRYLGSVDGRSDSR